MSKLPDKARPETIAARYAIDSDEQHGAVIPPLYLSSNFSFAGFGEAREYDYTRSGNPTRDQLAAALAALEGGAGGVVTATGMGAVHLVTQLVQPGETLVAANDCYGGCHRLFTAAAGGVESRASLGLNFLMVLGFGMVAVGLLESTGELAWGLVDPIREAWERPDAPTLAFYEQGSWGPAEADDLLARDGRAWLLGCGPHR